MTPGHDKDFLHIIGLTLTPSAWPLYCRRAFILTLPVSLPLWLLWNLVAVGLLVLSGAVIGGALAIRDMWKEDSKT